MCTARHVFYDLAVLPQKTISSRVIVRSCSAAKTFAYKEIEDTSFECYLNVQENDRRFGGTLMLQVMTRDKHRVFIACFDRLEGRIRNSKADLRLKHNQKSSFRIMMILEQPQGTNVRPAGLKFPFIRFAAQRMRMPLSF
jgi:hypothetical protein